MTTKILSNTNKLVKLKEEESMTPIKSEIEKLISQAINKKVPVETMEKLLSMRRELKQEKAKEEFDSAMSIFQSKCPTIVKDKKVYEKNSTTKVRYSYAPLESIVAQVKSHLSENGFSYRIKVAQDEKMISVTCIATHTSGHSEETTFSVPIGSESYMSDVQKYGARLTFAKRYVFCNAFGILTGDEDTDAITPEATEAKPAAHKPPIAMKATPFQIKKMNDLFPLKGKAKEELYNAYQINSLTELTIAQANNAIKRLEGMPTLHPKATGAVPENTPEDNPRSPETTKNEKEIEKNRPAEKYQIAWLKQNEKELIDLGLLKDAKLIDFMTEKEYRKIWDAYKAKK